MEKEWTRREKKMVRLTRFISLPLLLHVHVRCVLVCECVSVVECEIREFQPVECGVCVRSFRCLRAWPHTRRFQHVRVYRIHNHIYSVCFTHLVSLFPFSIFTVSSGAYDCSSVLCVSCELLVRIFAVSRWANVANCEMCNTKSWFRWAKQNKNRLAPRNSERDFF